MALEGRISTSGRTGTSGYTCSVVLYWEATQSVTNNTSTISWQLKSAYDCDSYVIISELRVSFDGEVIYYRDAQNHTRGYDGTVLASGTKTVTHNTDGKKEIAVKVEAGIYNWAINKEGTGAISLNTIPRASKINSFSGTDLSGSFSVNYTSYSNNFTNKLRISIPNVKALETFTYTSGTSFTLSQDSLNYLYAYTSNTDKVQLGAVIETYSGNIKIGESTEAIHDCYVPNTDEFRPKIGTIILDPTDINSQNILVQGKNAITIRTSGCEAGRGSSIKSYTFSGPGISYTGQHNEAISNGAIFTSGQLTYTVSN